MAGRTFKNNKWEHGLPINDQSDIDHERDGRPEDNRPGAPFWQRAAVSAPLIAGVGVGIHRLIGRDIFPSINFKRTSFLDKFRANIQSFGSDSAERVEELKSRRESTDPHLIKSAWEQALQSADPARTIRRVELDAENPLSTIEYFAKTNKSFQANKVIKNFIGQFKSLEQHAIATFSNPTDIKFSSIRAPKFTRRELGINQVTDPLLRESLTSIQKSINTIPEATMKISMAERSGMAGSQLMVTFQGGKFGTKGSSLELPMELSGPGLKFQEAGVIVHGTNQQTKRIVGRYGLIDPATNKITSTLKHEQYAAKLFEQEMIPKILSDNLKSSYQINKSINDFNRSVIEHGVWVNNLPYGIIPGHDAKVSFGRTIVNLVDKNSLSRLDSEATGKVLGNTVNNLFPSTSGNQLSKGIVSSRNAQDFWLAGRAFPFERQPMQALRRGYGPSKRSKAARAADSTRKQFSWMHTAEYENEFGDVSDIMAKTIYVSEKKWPGFGEKAFGGVAGGHALISSDMEDQLEHLDPLQVKVSTISDSLKPMMDISKTAEGLYDFKFPLNLKPNEIIGYDNMGKAVHFEENMKILGARLHSDNNQDFIKFYGARLTQPQHPKFFGSDKAVASLTKQNVMERLLRRESNLAFEGVKYITSIDTLKKNRSLHNSQMLAALHEFTLQNMQTKGKSVSSSEFASTAEQILSTAAGITYNNENVIQGVLGKAREAEFTPHQIGLTFGALPEVYGDEWRETLFTHGIKFSAEEERNIESGHAFGVSQLFYGGVPTSGGRGSVEPRFFEMLKGPQYGDLGHKIVQDIAGRQIISNPEVVMEQSLIEQSLGSISHGVFKMDGVSNYHISDMKPSIIEEITQKGGIVNFANTLDKAKSIYIPGADKSLFMRGFTTPQGEIVSNDLKHAYGDLLESASDVFHGVGKRKDAELAMGKLVGELGLAHAKTITGKGVGLARSQVMGSLYATVLPTTVDELGDLNTIGIGKHDAMGMFDQMKRMYEHSGLSDAKTKILELEERRQRLLAGGVVGAISSRDPDIGPYSIGASKLKIIPGLEKGYIKVPQQTKIITDAQGAEIGRVALGPMAGKAGDYDEDNAHVMLSSSEIEKDIMGHFHTGNPLLQAEQEYVIRQQLLKAKAPPSEGLTLGEEMLAGAEKLALSKEKVGPISTPFREIRAALTEARLPISEHLPAMSLLEALEQVPISGKHVPAQKIQVLREQMSRLGTAASRGKAFELIDIAQEVFNSSSLASNLLTKPQQVFMDGKELNIPGLDIDKSAATINKVMLDFKEKTHGVGNISEAGERAIIAGKRLLQGNQIESHLAYSGGLLEEFKMASKGIYASLGRAKSTVQNTISSVGGELLEHAGKPLAIGFGASLAIAAILSKPISNISGGPATPSIQSANSDSVRPETLHPDSEVSGAPTTSPPIPAPTARIQSDQRAHISIRGINRNNSNMSSISNEITSRLGGNTTVNVNIRDRKSSINQQKLDQLLRR